MRPPLLHAGLGLATEHLWLLFHSCQAWQEALSYNHKQNVRREESQKRDKRAGDQRRRRREEEEAKRERDGDGGGG